MASMSSPDFMHYCLTLCFLSVSSIVMLRFLIKIFTREKYSPIHYPPSPPALPILGHLHLLSSLLPKSFQVLARRYGPLMRIRIGQSAFVVVSNAATAKQVFKTHDANFASRFEFGPAQYSIYKGCGFITGPYGTYWRFMRKLSVTKLFTGTQLERFNHIREHEIRRLLKSLVKTSSEQGLCNLSAEFSDLTNNMLFRMILSKRFSKYVNEVREMRKLFEELLQFAAKLGVNEVHGLLKKIDLFGYGKKITQTLLRYDAIIEKIMKDYEENEADDEEKDLMDIVLETYRDTNAGVKITREQIKYFFLEILLASTDSTAAAIQWGMADLINNPEVFRKVRAEIDSVVGCERLVKESDIPGLPYLQAVAKESLRLHPPGAIIHRECIKDCKINGFDVKASDRILINAYAIMRDPESWSDPDKYQPERFLVEQNQTAVESRGQGFAFIPFGGGRRGCLGSTHAYLVIRGTIGALVQCFDWKLKEGENGIDINVGSGYAGAMAVPLECYPILRFYPF